MTPREINDLLDEQANLPRGVVHALTPARLAYQERKAELLSRIAAELDTTHAHATAAEAWRTLAELRISAEEADRRIEAGDA